MPVLPVAFSLMASFISSITLLGVSNEIYTYGTQFIVINVSYGKCGVNGLFKSSSSGFWIN